MATAADTEQPQRVTTLELFFDLVFVFTLTELTTVLFEAPNGRGLLRVVVMLGLIWWMYRTLAHVPGGQPIGALERVADTVGATFRRWVRLRRRRDPVPE